MEPNTTAGASGRVRACSATRSCTSASRAWSRSVALRARTTSASAVVVSGSRDSGRSGWATAPASSVVRCPANRAMVASSNRSVLYSTTPVEPVAPVSTVSARSSWLAPLSTGTGSTRSPGSSMVSAAESCSANSTCTKGEWLGSRVGARSSTRRSNGTSANR